MEPLVEQHPADQDEAEDAGEDEGDHEMTVIESEVGELTVPVLTVVSIVVVSHQYLGHVG
jgi:hypothetical protein